jgi:hypothetical protein
MRPRLPPLCRAAAMVLLACAACGNLGANQGDVVGGPGPIVAVGGSSGGGRSAGPDGGGARAGSGGSGGVGCLPVGASAACGACEATKCTTNAFIYGEGYDAATYDPGDPNNTALGQGIDWYHDCYASTGVVASGPMQGAKKSELCAEIVDCVHQSGCDASDTGNFPCYCGAGVTWQECSSPSFVPQGPCKDLIASGAESTTTTTVANRALDYSYAAGAALGLVIYCDYPTIGNSSVAGTCQTECLGGEDGGTTSCTAAPTDGGAPGDGGGSRPDGGGRAGAGGTGTGGAAGGSGGSGNGCTTTYSFTDAAGCARCELGSSSNYCDPTLLTATVTADPDGNPLPEGFGPETLATAAQQEAAFAIIHRVLDLKCYSDQMLHYRPADMPGCETLSQEACIWPNLGCLLDLGQHATDISSGTFATMPTYSAIAEYEAAAIADSTAGPATPDPSVGYGAPGGIPVGASNAVLGNYINVQATHPSSAIGLADTVLICGLSSGCSACFNLTATSSCPSGAAGATGAGGTAGSGSSDGAAGSGASGGGGRGGGACPDLDADGVPDCTETLVQNSRFDSATTGWTAEPGSSASWTSQDAGGNPSSGAIAVVNGDTNAADAPYGTTSAGAFQCLTVTPGACYQVDAQISIPSGQASVAAGFVLDQHTTGDCSQPPVTTFISPQISSTGAWRTIAGTTTRILLGVGSVAVRLVAVKPLGQSSAEALFDNVLVRPTACASP